MRLYLLPIGETYEKSSSASVCCGDQCCLFYSGASFGLIITMDGITDIVTEGITTDITITTTTIGTGLGLSASMGVQGIIAIGNRIIGRTAFRMLIGFSKLNLS